MKIQNRDYFIKFEFFCFVFKINHKFQINELNASN